MVKGCLASLFVEKVVEMMRCMNEILVDSEDEDLMMMVVVMAAM